MGSKEEPKQIIERRKRARTVERIVKKIRKKWIKKGRKVWKWKTKSNRGRDEFAPGSPGKRRAADCYQARELEDGHDRKSLPRWKLVIQNRLRSQELFPTYSECKLSTECSDCLSPFVLFFLFWRWYTILRVESSVNDL